MKIKVALDCCEHRRFHTECVVVSGRAIFCGDNKRWWQEKGLVDGAPLSEQITARRPKNNGEGICSRTPLKSPIKENEQKLWEIM